jgi:hypothetical protein
VWVWVASDNDNHARSIRTIVLHKLENVEEDGDQMVRKQQQRDEEERRSRRAELARPRASEPNGIDNHSVINQLFESLNTITNQPPIDCRVVEFATSAARRCPGHDLKFRVAGDFVRQYR